MHIMAAQFWIRPHALFNLSIYSKTCLKWPLKGRPKIVFQDRLSLNAGQTYCRMLHGEHFAIPLTFIKLPFAIKTFVLSIFERPLKTGFTVSRFFKSSPQHLLFINGHFDYLYSFVHSESNQGHSECN